MSNEIEAIKDPGLPAHVHRKADTDPKAADRAERQVATLFGISALGTILLIVSYIFIPDDVFIFIPVMGDQNAHQLGLGLGMAISLFFIGLGAIHWAKTLMPDTEVVAQRHEFRSPDSACNPYLAYAVMLAAGLAGVEGKYELRNNSEPETLPANLDEAIAAMEKSTLVRETLGEHVFEFVLRNKRAEWQDYRRQVSAYELDRYLPVL